MKALVLVGTFNLEKALIETFSMIVKTLPMVRLQLYHFSAPIPLCPILYATLVCAGKTVIYHPSSGEKVLCFCFENFSPPPPSIYLTGRDIKQARGHEVLFGAKLNRLSWRSLPCWHQQRSVALLHVLRVLRRPSD